MVKNQQIDDITKRKKALEVLKIWEKELINKIENNKSSEVNKRRCENGDRKYSD